MSESEGRSRRRWPVWVGGMQGLRAYRRSSFGFALGAAIAAAGVFIFAGTAQADDCPGHPDALGTSRVLVVEPGEYSQIGIMQYHQSLPLNDKEVVLTFDDGPVPRYSNAVLDTLAAQCVKATYFLVGTHTENHPARMQKLPIEKVRQEIDAGIADVGAALGDPTELAPFFRIPGLARTDAIDEELAARSLIVFSSDTVADDWHRRIRPADIVSRAMSRLEARGKGILLLHDIHPATVAALPELLAKLKAAAADSRRDEIALIDCSVKVFTQRSLLGGKPARDEAGRVFPHDAAVDDPIDDQNRTDRKQDENADAHDERRQQPEGEPIGIQMNLAAAAVAGHHGRPAR